MSSPMGTVVVTGAAGTIGSAIRAPLRDEVGRLVLLDRVVLPAQAAPGEEVLQVNLENLDAVVAAFAGADCVVHLAAVADEAPLADLLHSNVQCTYHVLEAARRQRVRRVVLASSNRVTGFHPVDQVIEPSDPVRPDGFYGVSKVAVEALGRLYADKFGLSVICLRIGSFADVPTEPRHLATWLSPRDCVGFIRAAIAAPDVDFAAVYAVSANTRGFWDTAAGARLGYAPVDDAERFAAQVPDAESFADMTVQGGRFASADFTLRHITPASPQR